MANQKNTKQRYERAATLLSWEDITSRKTGELMTKAAFLIDGRVYNAWLFGNERAAFVVSEKAKAVASMGDPARGVLSFTLSFSEKGVNAKEMAFV